MNTGIAFARKMSAAYTAVCKPLCQSLHLPQTAFDILMFLGNNPEYSTARDIVEVRQIKANLVSVNVDRLIADLDDATKDAFFKGMAQMETTLDMILEEVS